MVKVAVSGVGDFGVGDFAPPPFIHYLLYPALELEHVRVEVLCHLVPLVVEREPAVHERKELRKGNAKFEFELYSFLFGKATVSTNSNFFLSWTSCMRQTYSRPARMKSRCSISRVASAWK